MKCLGCGLDAGFNRVVIDIAGDDLVGGLCGECELLEFGRAVPDEDTGYSSCASCPHEGEYALPRIELLVESEETGAVRDIEYQLTRSTTVICEERLDGLRGSSHHHAVASLVSEAES